MSGVSAVTSQRLASRPVRRTELTIGGMTCASCATRVEKTLNRLDGVTAAVNLATETAAVTFPAGVSAEDLVAVAEQAGDTAVPEQDEQASQDEGIVQLSAQVGAPLVVRSKIFSLTARGAPPSSGRSDARVSAVTSQRPAGRTVRRTELAISGMTCASCAARIEKKLNKLDGVTAAVNFATETAAVTFPAGVSAEDLVAAVEQAGYIADVPQGGQGGSGGRAVPPRSGGSPGGSSPRGKHGGGWWCRWRWPSRS